MAPDPTILKRKRSRPSDWWAAARSPAPPPPAKESHPVQSRKIQEAPAAGNRGISLKNAGRQGADGAGNPIQTSRTVESKIAANSSVTGPNVGKADQIKRKRDRPSAEDDAEGAVGVPIREQTINQGKRGRTRVAHTEQDATPDVAGNTQATSKKKKGRSSASQATVPIHLGRRDRKDTPEKQKSKTGAVQSLRKAHSSDTQEELEAAITSTKTQAPERNHTAKKASNSTSMEIRRGRSSNNEAEIQAIFDEATKVRRGDKEALEAPAVDKEVKAPVDSTQEDPPHKRRTRRSEAAIIESSVIGSSESESWHATRGRRSNTVLEVETATSSFAKYRSKTKKAIPTTALKPASSSANQPRKPKRPEPDTEPLESEGRRVAKRKSDHKATDQLHSRERKQDEESRTSSKPIKRRRIEEHLQPDEDIVPEMEQVPAYQRLQPMTRQVSRQIIQTKWEPLPPSCVELISQFLDDLQRHVAVRFSDERRKNQASTALQMVSGKLVHKISKGLPFPGHREDDFNFEKILDHNRALEAQLTPALHANELLQAEVKKETMLLESEQAALKELEANAKTAETRRRQAGRDIHSLLQSEGFASVESRMANSIALRDDHKALPFVIDSEEYKDLNLIFEELNGHVDSMQGNLNQVQGITEAMGKSRAAVQATLFEYLEGGQYQDVILGEDI